MSSTLEYVLRYFDLHESHPELYELMLKGTYLALNDLYENGFHKCHGTPLFYEIYVHYAFLGYARTKRVETLLNLPPLLSTKFEEIMRERIDFMIENEGSWYPKDEYGGYVGRNAWALMMLSELGFPGEDPRHREIENDAIDRCLLLLEDFKAPSPVFYGHNGEPGLLEIGPGNIKHGFFVINDQNQSFLLHYLNY